MKTLNRFHADTGLPIDMIVTLLNENHIDYNEKEVMELENKDCLEGEGVIKEKITLPSEIDLSEIECRQVVDNSNVYSLQPTSITTSILQSFPSPSSSKQSYVFLKDCPFFPSQAGQEGDKGILRIHSKEFPVVNTVENRNRDE